eukprot:8848972-Alexandrium_andersonii.AAC.1
MFQALGRRETRQYPLPRKWASTLGLWAAFFPRACAFVLSLSSPPPPAGLEAQAVLFFVQGASCPTCPDGSDRRPC